MDSLPKLFQDREYRNMFTRSALKANNANPLDICFILDTNLFSNDDDFCYKISILSDLLQKENAYSGNKGKLRKALNIIACNILYAYHDSDYTYVQFSRSKGKYTKLKQYYGECISYSCIVYISNILASLRFVELYIGDRRSNPNGRRESAMKAKTKFVNFFDGFSLDAITYNSYKESIILKDKNKDRIPYSDNTSVKKSRKNLAVINKCICSANISHHGFSSCKTISGYGQSYHRVFNVRFDKGGRFYGPWWLTEPKEVRKTITINDEPTIELDYSAYHPSILYAKRGLSLPHGDLYVPHTLPFHPERRGACKSIFLRLLNASSEKAALLSIARDRPSGAFSYDDCKKMLYCMQNMHAAISDFFFSGIGLDLQFEDSCLAETIMLEFANKGIPVLGIHDSFIIQKKHEDMLRETMTSAYEDKYGITPRID